MIRLNVLYGVSGCIFAVQNDGVVYYAKKIKDAPRGFWADDYFKDALKLLNEASKMVQ